MHGFSPSVTHPFSDLIDWGEIIGNGLKNKKKPYSLVKTIRVHSDH